MIKKVVKKAKVVKKEPRIYDSNKPYVWNPDDSFVLSGTQFGLIYQTLKNEALSPGGVAAKQKVDTFSVIENILRIHYEAGIGEEHIQPQQN